MLIVELQMAFSSLEGLSWRASQLEGDAIVLVTLAILPVIFLISLVILPMLFARYFANRLPEIAEAHHIHFNRLSGYVQFYEDKIEPLIPEEIRPVFFYDYDQQALQSQQQLTENFELAQILHKEIESSLEIYLRQIESTSHPVLGKAFFLIRLRNIIIHGHRQYEILLMDCQRAIEQLLKLIGYLKEKKYKVHQQISQLQNKLMHQQQSLANVHLPGEAVYKEVEKPLNWGREALKRAEKFEKISSEIMDKEISIASADLARQYAHSCSQIFDTLIKLHELSDFHYELDETKRFIDTILARLVQGQSLMNATGWHELFRLQTIILKIGHSLTQVKSSLEVFQHQRADLLEKQKKWLESGTIQKLGEESFALEDKCKVYFGGCTEHPIEWDRIMDGLEPPSIQIEQLRYFISTQITAYIEGRLIKQSEIPSLLSNFQYLEEQVGMVKQAYQVLETAYQEESVAESLVHQMLKGDSYVDKSIKRLLEIDSFTSDEIRMKIQEQRYKFESLMQATEKRTLANFKGIHTDLETLEKKNNAILNEHRKLINQLEGQARAKERKVNNYFRQLEAFLDYRPIIEIKHNKFKQQITKLQSLRNQSLGNHDLIMNFLKLADSVIEELTDARSKAKSSFEKYSQERKLMESRLWEIEERLKEIQRNLDEWNIGIENQDKINQLKFYRTNLEELERSDTSVSQAIANCRRIYELAMNNLRDAENKYQAIKNELDYLNSSYKTVMDAIHQQETGQVMFTPNVDYSQIRTFCAEAKKVGTLSEAKAKIDLAKSSLAVTVGNRAVQPLEKSNTNISFFDPNSGGGST